MFQMYWSNPEDDTQRKSESLWEWLDAIMWKFGECDVPLSRPEKEKLGKVGNLTSVKHLTYSMSGATVHALHYGTTSRHLYAWVDIIFLVVYY